MRRDRVADWNFEEQKADTEWMIRDLTRRGAADPGQEITLDIQFLPAEDAKPDQKGCAAALRKAGFEAHLYEEDGEPVVEATAERARFTLESVWIAERMATEIALRFGFEPEGWGFVEARDL